MEEREQLKINFWKAVFEAVKFRQENGLSRDFYSMVIHELKFNAKILNRVPDLRGVNIDDTLVTDWLSFESLSQEERRVMSIRLESERNLRAESMPGEEWKPIEGYEHYLVSNFGRLWSLRRRRGLLKPQFRNSGHAARKNPTKWYLYIHLTDYKKGIDEKFLVHRLVAKAFLPNPNNYPQIDHIDEDPQNNRVDNLRWCTQEQNLKYYANRHYVSD